jgi:hypothetical protein
VWHLMLCIMMVWVMVFAARASNINSIPSIACPHQQLLHCCLPQQCVIS